VCKNLKKALGAKGLTDTTTSVTAEANFFGRCEDAISFNGRENVKGLTCVMDRDVYKVTDCKMCDLCASFVIGILFERM
jgi:hypothetical protein